MDMIPGFVLLAAFVVAGVGLIFVFRATRGGSGDTQRTVAEMAGRLAQFAEAQGLAQARLADTLHRQQLEVSKLLDERLNDVSRRMGEGMQQTTEKTLTQMRDLGERLAVIDAAQKTITDLSVQVVSLQDVLSNKQARGAFGEVQLHDLVVNVLPPSAYAFQATLGNGKRVDCLLTLPNPPGAIAVDAKFPLESWHALRAARDESELVLARRGFAQDVLKHIKDIADKYIIPGETADSALMFLPSEAIYAELHANFPEVVDKSYRAKVWIVSPTTLMATLNTVRAILKDAKMREQAGLIQIEVGKMMDDVKRLLLRVNNLDSHFGQAQKDIGEIKISAEKVLKGGDRIERVELGDAALGPAQDLPLL